MAKKAKAKMSKAKKTTPVSRARTAKASAPAVTPTYLPEGQSYTMGLHDVVRALKVIDKHGHMPKFVKAAKAEHAAGTFNAKTVNFVKDFMVKNKMHNDPVGKHIVNARQPAPVGLTATAAAAPSGLTAAAATGRFNCNF
jgi:hypothetical protein